MVLDSQPVGLRAGLGRTVAAATALALAAAGCGYQSPYVAPQDGRARVVWGHNDEPLVEMAGAAVASQCSTELSNLVGPGRLPHSSGELRSGPPPNIYVTTGSGYWSPHFYGPPIIVTRPGFAPPFRRAPVYLPRLAGSLSGHSVSAGLHTSGVVHGGGGSSGSSLGGGKDAGVLLVILAVIAVTTLPAVALGLAAAMPESRSKSSSAIDMVNAYNDLARLDGTPCTPAPYFAPGELPPVQEPPQ